jgi:hypothetical protein
MRINKGRFIVDQDSVSPSRSVNGASPGTEDIGLPDRTVAVGHIATNVCFLTLCFCY